MRTLQLGNIDTMGTRFNGQDLHKQFLKRGIESQHCVWEKRAEDAATWEMNKIPARHLLNAAINRVESFVGVQSLLQPFPYVLPFDRRFRSVDLVHYHLIHTGYFSLTSLPLLSRLKPAVWTLHDPWAMTGHCLYPFDCERWKTGCGACPRLDIAYAMRRDHTALMWRIKKAIYGFSDVDIVVASKWMMNMAKASPLVSNFRIHLIPFGIDLSVFAPGDPEQSKKELGVPPGNVVICLRSTLSPFKGVQCAIEALSRIETSTPITILTFNEMGHFNRFIGKHQIIELGWVDELALTVKAYNAVDIFLMPSTAEAFGMMAMEAMACGKPVVCFDGTSLPEVIFAPEGGVSVPQYDVEALAKELYDLIENGNKRRAIGLRAREIAVNNYGIDLHVDRILALYEDVIARRQARRTGVTAA